MLVFLVNMVTYPGSLLTRVCTVGLQVFTWRGHQRGVPRDPLDMRALLDSNLWDGMLFEDMFDMLATMFQPVGGMDRIAAAFEKKLSHGIRFDASVEQIRKHRRACVSAIGTEKRGMAAAIEADCCICAMPLSILKTIDTDFPRNSSKPSTPQVTTPHTR